MKLTITDAARTKIIELRDAENKQGVALRMGIQGRGPGGFNYVLRFVGPDERTPEDLVVDGDGFEIVVEPGSVENLEGTTIDYGLGMTGAGFKFNNPKASGTCGCGSSFAV